MNAAARHALIALAVALLLLVPAVAAGVEPRTPVPGAQAQAPIPKLSTPTPLPIRRDDLPVKLPPCSVTGSLKWDAQLLKDSNTPAPPYGANLCAYSGTMTITANKALTGFTPIKVVASIVGGSEVGDCGGWTIQQVNLAKGQSWTYPVRCLWGGANTYALPVEGVVKVGYAPSILAFCDGKVTIGK
jgi:hypothetical protein